MQFFYSTKGNKYSLFNEKIIDLVVAAMGQGSSCEIACKCFEDFFVPP